MGIGTWLFKAYEKGISSATELFTKLGGTYTAAKPPAKAAMTKAAKSRGALIASASATAIAAPIAGFLAYWGFGKVDDGTKAAGDYLRAVGAVAIFAGVVAVSVGAYVVLKRGKL